MKRFVLLNVVVAAWVALEGSRSGAKGATIRWAPSVIAVALAIPLFQKKAAVVSLIIIACAYMLQAAPKVDGRVLLANLFLLFWLSLVPFVVRWVGEAGVTRDTVLAFGVIMLLCALSVALLRSALLAANTRDAPIARAARGRKGMITIVAYALAIAIVFVWPLVAVAIYFAVAAMWLVPDKRFERLLDQ